MAPPELRLLWGRAHGLGAARGVRGAWRGGHPSAVGGAGQPVHQGFRDEVRVADGGRQPEDRERIPTHRVEDGHPYRAQGRRPPCVGCGTRRSSRPPWSSARRAFWPGPGSSGPASGSTHAGSTAVRTPDARGSSCCPSPPNASASVAALKRSAYLFARSMTMPVNVSGMSRCHVLPSRRSMPTGRLTLRRRLVPGSHTLIVRSFTAATSLLLNVRCSMLPQSMSLAPIASSEYASPRREPRNLRPVARSMNVTDPPRRVRVMPCESSSPASSPMLDVLTASRSIRIRSRSLVPLPFAEA